jgi:hypothetical protein
MQNLVFPSITGRDWFLVGQSLVYAVGAIDDLSPERRDYAIRNEMVAVFNSLFSDDVLRAQILQGVETARGKPCQMIAITQGTDKKLN